MYSYLQNQTFGIQTIFIWISRINNEGSQAMIRRQKLGQVNRKQNVKMRSFILLLVPIVLTHKTLHCHIDLPYSHEWIICLTSTWKFPKFKTGPCIDYSSSWNLNNTLSINSSIMQWFIVVIRNKSGRGWPKQKATIHLGLNFVGS